MLGSRMPLLDPVSAAWNTVAKFGDYESAQRAVDRLSDDGFPVEKLDIVGSGLRLVERVTGRLTSGAFAGDNLSHPIGYRPGPAAECRLLSTTQGRTVSTAKLVWLCRKCRDAGGRRGSRTGALICAEGRSEPGGQVVAECGG
jgi:hypothetical protein